VFISIVIGFKKRIERLRREIEKKIGRERLKDWKIEREIERERKIEKERLVESKKDW